MPSAKYTEVYQKIRDMGDKLKTAGKQGPSNDEQLKVCFVLPYSLVSLLQTTCPVPSCPVQ